MPSENKIPKFNKSFLIRIVTVLSLVLNLGLATLILNLYRSNLEFSQYINSNQNYNQTLLNSPSNQSSSTEEKHNEEDDHAHNKNVKFVYKLSPENYLTGIITKSDTSIEGPKISMIITRREETLEGRYIYDEQKEPLLLKPEILSQSNQELKLKLVEENLQGQNTGFWIMEFAADDSDKAYVKSSTWQKDNNSTPQRTLIEFSESKFYIPKFSSKENLIKIISKKEKHETDDYYINYSIPTITGMKDKVIEAKINQNISSSIDWIQTTKNLQEFSNEKCLPGDSADYNVTFNKGGYLSLEVSGYLFTCGAHGSHTFKTFNIDLKTGKILNLKDIVIANSGYLNKFSTSTENELNKAYKDVELWKEGYSPNEENFQNWVFNESGLQFIFEDYQVGAYALGNPVITISFEDLKETLKTEYIFK